MPKESKATANPTMPTAPIPAVPTAPIPTVLVISLPSYHLRLEFVSLHPSLLFVFSLGVYTLPYILFQVHLPSKWLQPLDLRLVAVLPLFLILWVRFLPSLSILSRPRPMTSTPQTSRVLDLLMLTSMAFEYLRSVLYAWRPFTAAGGLHVGIPL